ncbi:MAG: hypothetical protein ACJAZ3_001325 [Sphingobacteriales bacterium]|jgi:hypothetical protein
MKYTFEVTIDRPLKRVVELFENPNNMKEWQKGFLSLEPISGESGKAGSSNMLVYKMGKRKIEMVEIIEKNDLPREFVATYEAPGVWNRVKNTFHELPNDQCMYITEHEFIFSTLTMKLFSFLMPGAFKKQSKVYMVDFKTFVERS